MAAFLNPGAWGRDFAEWLDQYKNTAGMWLVGEDMPQETNRVTLHPTEKDQFGLPIPNVHFDDHANDVAMRDRPVAASRFGPTTGSEQPPRCDEALSAGESARLTVHMDATVDLRPVGTIDLTARLLDIPRRDAERRIEEAFASVQLADVADKRVATYSRGMRQRLGIAEIVMKKAEVAILDEPTSGLDPLGARWMKNLILELRRQGKTVIMCSHRLEDVQDICDRIAILDGGELKVLGRVQDLLKDQGVTQIKTSRLPDAVFVVDTKKEKIAVDEARKLKIPVIGIVDTNCDPDEVDFVIPGNDDALRAIRLFASRIADAVLSGRGLKESAEADNGRDASGGDSTGDNRPPRAPRRPREAAPTPA
jgi:ABC-type dipeptide/oligopeptide/nickel transport system ATPase component